MNNDSKSREELIEELAELRRQISDLRKTEERFIALSEATTDYIFTKDLDYRYTYVNCATAELFGCEPGDIIGKTAGEIFEPSYAKEVSEADKSALEGNTVNRILIMPIDGQDHVLHAVQAPLKKADGEVRGICAVVRDITELRKSEEILKKERERAQQYLDLAAVMLIAIDNAGIVTLANKKSCEVLGYTEEEIVGSNWFDKFLPSTLIDTVKNVYMQLLRGEVEPAEYFENPVLTKNGEERLIAWHNTILRDSNGMIIGTITSGEDVTERKKTEEKLSELLRVSEERSKELFCLYRLSESFRTRKSLENVFQDTAELIPSGWHYPEITRSKVVFDGKEYVSEPFEETDWTLSSDIIVNDETRGAIRVSYLEECPVFDEGPFMTEERELLDGISRSLSEVVQRKLAEEELDRRMEEIERINRLFTGREYRVLEMKQEVNKLLEKLGKPGKYTSADELAKQSEL